MLEQEEVIKEPSEQPIVVEALHPAAEQKPPDLLAHGSLEVEQQRIPLSEVWKRLHGIAEKIDNHRLVKMQFNSKYLQIIAQSVYSANESEIISLQKSGALKQTLNLMTKLTWINPMFNFSCEIIIKLLNFYRNHGKQLSDQIQSVNKIIQKSKNDLYIDIITSPKQSFKKIQLIWEIIFLLLMGHEFNIKCATDIISQMLTSWRFQLFKQASIILKKILVLIKKKKVAPLVLKRKIQLFQNFVEDLLSQNNAVPFNKQRRLSIQELLKTYSELKVNLSNTSQLYLQQTSNITLRLYRINLFLSVWMDMIDQGDRKKYTKQLIISSREPQTSTQDIRTIAIFLVTADYMNQDIEKDEIMGFYSTNVSRDKICDFIILQLKRWLQRQEAWSKNLISKLIKQSYTFLQNKSSRLKTQALDWILERITEPKSKYQIRQLLVLFDSLWLEIGFSFGQNLKENNWSIQNLYLLYMDNLMSLNSINKEFFKETTNKIAIRVFKLFAAQTTEIKNDKPHKHLEKAIQVFSDKKIPKDLQSIIQKLLSMFENKIEQSLVLKLLNLIMDKFESQNNPHTQMTIRYVVNYAQSYFLNANENKIIDECFSFYASLLNFSVKLYNTFDSKNIFHEKAFERFQKHYSSDLAKFMVSYITKKDWFKDSEIIFKLIKAKINTINDQSTAQTFANLLIRIVDRFQSRTKQNKYQILKNYIFKDCFENTKISQNIALFFFYCIQKKDKKAFEKGLINIYEMNQKKSNLNMQEMIDYWNDLLEIHS